MDYQKYYLSIFRMFGFLFFGLLITNCSYSPSTKKGKELIKSTINQFSVGIVTIVDFQKINGEYLEDRNNIYRLEFSGTVQFDQNGSIYPDPIEGGFDRLILTTKKPNGIDWLLYEGVSPQVIHAFQNIHIAGDIYYRKTDNGWLPEDFKVNSLTRGNITYTKRVIKKIIRNRFVAWINRSGINYSVEKFEVDFIEKNKTNDASEFRTFNLLISIRSQNKTYANKSHLEFDLNEPKSEYDWFNWQDNFVFFPPNKEIVYEITNANVQLNGASHGVSWEDSALIIE